MADLNSLIVDDTGSLDLPAGTTSQRPSSPAAGSIRYNTDTNLTEYYSGSNWVSVVPRSNNLPYTIGFEGGFGPEWTQTNNFSIFSSPVVNGRPGARSAGQSGSSIDAICDLTVLFGSPQKFNGIQFYWYELSSQTGFTVDFRDAEGNRVFAAGGNNPQWELADGDGTTQQNVFYSGTGYDRWIYYAFRFDWNNGTYDYYLRDIESSNTVNSGTRTLLNATPIAEMRIGDIIGRWGSASHMWFDDFTFE